MQPLEQAEDLLGILLVNPNAIVFDTQPPQFSIALS
jgi:hypothetical protein